MVWFDVLTTNLCPLTLGRKSLLVSLDANFVPEFQKNKSFRDPLDFVSIFIFEHIYFQSNFIHDVRFQN